MPFHIPSGRLLVMGWKSCRLYLYGTHIDLLVSPSRHDISKEVDVPKVIVVWLDYAKGVEGAIESERKIPKRPSHSLFKHFIELAESRRALWPNRPSTFQKGLAIVYQTSHHVQALRMHC